MRTVSRVFPSPRDRALTFPIGGVEGERLLGLSWMPDTPDDASFAAPIPTGTPSTRTKVIRVAVTLGVLVAVFFGVLPRFADYSEVGPILAELAFGEVVLLLGLALWFLAAYWLVLMAVLPTLRWREAAVNQLAGTAVSNTVPAGGAVAVGVNYSMYLSWGFAPEQVWAGLLTAGVWDSLLKAAVPVAAVSLFALGADETGVGWSVPLIGAALLVAMMVALVSVLRSEAGARLVGRGLGRVANPPLRLLGRTSIDFEGRLQVFRRTLVDLLAERWGRLTLAMAGNHLAMFAVFVASLRVVGVDELGLVPLLVAFSLARLLSGVPITPGGLGVVDAGYVALLSLTASADSDAAIVAGVLLFRALTFFPPIPLGLGTWLFWRANRSWRKPAGSRKPVAA